MASPARQASRLVILDAHRSVLLLRYEASRRRGATSFWATPGGGLEPGESPRDAAQRELAEETGLVAPVCQELWRLKVEFESDTGLISQDEHFFLVELAGVAPTVHNSSPEPIQEHRWWALSELSASNEVIYPEDLGARIASLISGAA